jgi:signal transduction histidine kinase
MGEKGKVLQILVNLIRNAKHATQESDRSNAKVITLRIEQTAPHRVRLIVQDNGVGIPPENIPKLFNHGFTTRTNGHGFGLHSSLNVAREMKATLTAHSEGLGTGATFTLELPAAP